MLLFWFIGPLLTGVGLLGKGIASAVSGGKKKEEKRPRMPMPPAKSLAQGPAQRAAAINPQVLIPDMDRDIREQALGGLSDYGLDQPPMQQQGAMPEDPLEMLLRDIALSKMGRGFPGF